MINTSIAKLPKPQLNDVANIETSTHPYSKLADTMMVPRFANIGARNTAIPVPSNGMLCWVTSTGELYRYSGSWISAVPRIIRKVSNSQNVVNSTTFVNDDTLSFAVEANSVYTLEMYFGFDTDTTADFKERWTIPTGATVWGSWMAQDGNNPADGAIYGQFVFDGTTYVIHAASAVVTTTGIWERTFIKTTSPGTMQLQWAQNVATGSTTRIQTNAFILVSKVE